MRLYIVRHGETKWNRERRLQGSTDVELNDKGIALAKSTGKALAEVPFRRAFSSPLKRAVVTAKLILGERQTPLILDERLKEISFGNWEGRCIDPARKELPDSFEKLDVTISMTMAVSMEITVSAGFSTIMVINVAAIVITELMI